MQDKRASVLMISLWILSILVILAVSLGHRAVISLKLARNQRDGLKARLYAESGIYNAIGVLKNDVSKDYDSLDETWSTGKDDKDKLILDNVQIRDDYEGGFLVKYLCDKDTGEYRCMSDEESRININEINTPEKQQILLKLFEYAEIDKPEDFNKLFINWIDTNSLSGAGEDICIKHQPLKIPEELLLILEYYYGKNNADKSTVCKKAREAYNKIKDLITVYSDNGRININTVLAEAIAIFTFVYAQKEALAAQAGLGTYLSAANNLAGEINGYIAEHPFKSSSELETFFSNLTITEEQNIAATLKSAFEVKSNFFRIESTGISGRIEKRITVIYNRSAQSFLYWKEE